MKKIKINNEIISLITENLPHERDVSFSLKISDICVIGICNTLVFDDDTDIIVFIDSLLNVHTITIAHISNTDLERLYLLISQKFEINLNTEFSKNIDKCIVLYPNSLYKESIYEENIFEALKAKIGFKNINKLTLSEKVKNYITTK